METQWVVNANQLIFSSVILIIKEEGVSARLQGRIYKVALSYSYFALLWFNQSLWKY